MSFPDNPEERDYFQGRKKCCPFDFSIVMNYYYRLLIQRCPFFFYGTELAGHADYFKYRVLYSATRSLE